MTEPLPRRTQAAPRLDFTAGEQKLLTAAWLAAVYVGVWLSLTPPIAPAPPSPPVRVASPAAEPARPRSTPARAPRLRTRSS